MKVDQKTLTRLQNKLSRAQDTDVIEGTLARIGEDLIGQAIPLAPVDEGNLRGSGNSQFYVGDRGPGVEVGFDEEYAWVQHERLDFDHPKGGQAKYLSTPYDENRKRYVEAIKRAAIRQAKGGR